MRNRLYCSIVCVNTLPLLTDIYFSSLLTLSDVSALGKTAVPIAAQHKRTNHGKRSNSCEEIFLRRLISFLYIFANLSFVAILPRKTRFLAHIKLSCHNHDFIPRLERPL